MKAILRYLLACNYSFARRWVNPKYGGDVMWTTVHGFLTPISFIAAAFYAMASFFLNNGSRLDSSYAYSIPVFLIIVGIGYGFRKPTKNAIFQWGIEKEFKSLSKKQRRKSVRPNRYGLFG